MVFYKKTAVLFAFIAFFFVSPLYLYAQVSEELPVDVGLDSYSGDSSSPALDHVIQYPVDSHLVDLDLYNMITYSTSTDYTVLGGWFTTLAWDTNSNTIYCGNDSITFGPFSNVASGGTYSGWINLHCKAGTTLRIYDEPLIYAQVWVVDRDTRVSSEVTYRDWLFVSVTALFLLAFVPLGVVFSLFRNKKYDI